MRRAITLLFVVIVVAACGSHETSPPRPHAIGPEHAPTKAPTTTSHTPTPTPDAPQVFADVRALPPAEATVPDEPPWEWHASADGAPDGVETSTLSGHGDRFSISVPNYASGLVRRQIRARLEDASGVQRLESNADLDGSCDVTVATATLASFYCHGDVDWRGDGWPIAKALTLRIDHDETYELSASDTLLDGDLDNAARTACHALDPDAGVAPAAAPPPADDEDEGDQEGEEEEDDGMPDPCDEGASVELALGPTGFTGAMVYRPYSVGATREIEIPYADVLPMLDREGPLATVPGAFDGTADVHAGELLGAIRDADSPDPIPLPSATPPAPTAPVAPATPPPPNICALTGSVPWADLAWAFVRARPTADPHAPVVHVVALPPGHAELVGELPCDRFAAVSAALGVAAVPQHALRSRANLGRALLTSSTPLRRAPAGLPLRELMAGTAVVIVDGDVEIEGHSSAWSSAPGLSVFAIVGGETGWLPVQLLESTEDPLSPAALAAIVATAPSALRAELLREAVVVARPNFPKLVYATSAAHGTYAWRDDAPGPPVHADGTMTRLYATREPTFGDVLLVVATRVEGDDAGIERWAFFRNGAASPTLTLSLPSGEATPERRRVRVEIERDRDPMHRYPFAVRGPGRAETDYAWSGDTLVVAP